MNKSLIALAVVGVLAAPLTSAYAKKDIAKVYGVVHIAVERVGKDANLDVNSSYSKGTALGVKGGVGAGSVKVNYKMELGLDTNQYSVSAADSAAETTPSVFSPGVVYQRDTWIGIKSGMGQVRIGTMGTLYKTSGKMIDPLFTTALEGRGHLATMSKLHSGNGIAKGRSTNTIIYDTPKISGIAKINFHYQTNGENPNYGGGITLNLGSTDLFVATVSNYNSAVNNNQSAYKVGGRTGFGAIGLSGQLETGKAIDDDTKAFGSASYTMGMLTIAATGGYTLDDDGDNDLSFGAAVLQKLSKKTTAYVGGGLKMPGEDSLSSESAWLAGIKHKF